MAALGMVKEILVFLPCLRDARIAALRRRILGRKLSRQSRSRNLVWCIEFPRTVCRLQIIRKKRHLSLKVTDKDVRSSSSQKGAIPHFFFIVYCFVLNKYGMTNL